MVEFWMYIEGRGFADGLDIVLDDVKERGVTDNSRNFCMSRCRDGIATNLEKVGRCPGGKGDQKFPFGHIKCEMERRYQIEG